MSRVGINLGAMIMQMWIVQLGSRYNFVKVSREQADLEH